VIQQHTNNRPAMSTPCEAAMSVKYTQGKPQCLNYLLFDLLLILFVNNIRSFELFIDLGFNFSA
jgi:hypothetical protein